MKNSTINNYALKMTTPPAKSHKNMTREKKFDYFLTKFTFTCYLNYKKAMAR